ncbi:glyceraldehyde-3-phosphate dehydrogenase, cytosolic-like [Acyrthosiphon pisum]|uniref:Uncharacterized protein n=1 Tax=Acyrthosiphon pisum TaxID=7029 RepID=A0A8R2D6R0_ACYPI|nr:glyceraldehyde-3-phosphate dehydrogenase, cytosolic-like [Acyrthosiphon pisum]
MAVPKPQKNIRDFFKLKTPVKIQELIPNEVVAINGPAAEIEDIAYSLKYDTIHGTFGGNISVKADNCPDIDGNNCNILYT